MEQACRFDSYLTKEWFEGGNFHGTQKAVFGIQNWSSFCVYLSANFKDCREDEIVPHRFFRPKRIGGESGGMYMIERVAPSRSEVGALGAV